jgi:hypothetical protein
METRGTGNAILCYVDTEGVMRKIVSLIENESAFHDKHGFCFEEAGIRLHSTIAVRVSAISDSSKRLLRTERLVDDLVVGNSGTPQLIELSEVNVQKDSTGRPYSLNILLKDTAGSIISPVVALKHAFFEGADTTEAQKHDRYHPRAGHITLVSARKCPRLFQNAERMDSLIKNIKDIIAADKNVPIQAIGFPEKEVPFTIRNNDHLHSKTVFKYPLYLLNRHLFIDLPEGRALIDTGAPFSSSTTGRLTWKNQNHKVNHGGYMGFTFDKLSAEISTQVDALLGMDLLKQTTLLFDVAHRTLTAGDKMPKGFPAHHRYERPPMSDIPIFQVTLNNQPARVLWDTGAQFGYVTDRKFVEGARALPGFQDFSPLFGDLHMQTSYVIPIRIAGHEQTLLETVGEAPTNLRGGVSPVPMEPFLRALGVDAIVGGASWMPHVKVWLNPLDQSFAVTV